MKTLTDFFQKYELDYELIDHPRFGTVAVIFYANTSMNLNPIMPFGPTIEAILKKAGMVENYMTIYLPHLSDEEVLALSITGKLVQYISPVPSPTFIPQAVLYQFERNERFGITNWFFDMRDDEAFRSTELRYIGYAVAAFAASVVVNFAF